ncbi:hypothetical protein DITRI_Ditri20bG0025200 [Diplodiscus trichospermus]
MPPPEIPPVDSNPNSVKSDAQVQKQPGNDPSSSPPPQQTVGSDEERVSQQLISASLRHNYFLQNCV